MGVEREKNPKNNDSDDSTATAGFPSPASDYIESPIDFNELLIQNEPATFCFRARGDSMEGASIQNGDLLVVDKSRKLENQNIVVAVVDGEFTVKRYLCNNNGKRLTPANTSYKPIEITDESEIQIWGVVVYVIHKSA